MMKKSLFVVQSIEDPALYLGRYDLGSKLDWVPLTWAYTYDTERQCADAAVNAYLDVGQSRIVDVYAVNRA